MDIHWMLHVVWINLRLERCGFSSVYSSIFSDEYGYIGRQWGNYVSSYSAHFETLTSFDILLRLHRVWICLCCLFLPNISSFNSHVAWQYPPFQHQGCIGKITHASLFRLRTRWRYEDQVNSKQCLQYFIFLFKIQFLNI